MTTFLIFIIILMFIIAHNILKSKYVFYRNNYTTFLFSLIVLWIVITIIIYPKQSVEAAKSGLLTWVNVIIPSLLPFFIGSELMIGMGIVRFIGVILQPIMRPIFNVPGEGAFSLAMSVTSGYPVGAKMVSQLRRQGTISRIEAQRLISFCSTSGPLFMIGAVSIGMFGNPSIGIIIISAHYLAALTIGIAFRFYGLNKDKKKQEEKNRKPTFRMAINEMVNAREADGRTIGALMGDAVKEGLNTMLIVGGFIILYSVVINAFEITNIYEYITSILTMIVPINLDISLLKGFLSGIVEMTNGCKIISQVDTSSLGLKITAASFLIGWSGLSIHSQAINFLSKSDINIKIYILTKAFHGGFAAIYSYIIYQYSNIKSISPLHVPTISLKEPIQIGNWFHTFNFSIRLEISIIISLLLTCILIGILNKFKFFKKV